ncbi:MAG: adenine deaminase C-terminal domain-containing protein [Lachnospiraceae bacterium]|nr:adenine deaminase C-terminal domain-containing protein [Lachnospiraceae bacterium]
MEWKNQVDCIYENAQVYNSYFKEFYPADVSVTDGKIYYIDYRQEKKLPAAKTIDVSGSYMIPGLIDIHMHIESSMMTPQVFCEHLASCGVTTIVSEPHEMANVNGIRGVLDMIDAGASCPVDIFYGIPSCVPSTSEELETTGGIIDFSAMKKLLENERIICVGEVMNYRQIIQDNQLEIGKFLEYLKEQNLGLVIEGHCPKLVDLDLARFLYLGINGDHTEHSLEELRQRFANGMYVELQEKMLSREVLEFIETHQLYEHFGFVTDDVMADTLYEEGQLDMVVRKAIALGMKPEQAIYNATFTNARRMNLSDRGVLAPGKRADFVLIESPCTLKVQASYKDGVCIYPSDKSETVACRHSFGSEYYHSIHLSELSTKIFELPVEKELEAVTVRAMKVCDGSTKTEEIAVTLPVKDGLVQWENSECMLAVVMERYGKNKNCGYGFVCGDAIHKGAVATSYAHDSHNLLIVGATPADMQAAANKVIELQGGIVTACGGTVTAALPLPVGGILSDRPIGEISRDLKKVRAELLRQGYHHHHPIMSLCTLTLPVSPALKLTDHGLINVEKGEIVSLFL